VQPDLDLRCAGDAAVIVEDPAVFIQVQVQVLCASHSIRTHLEAMRDRLPVAVPAGAISREDAARQDWLLGLL